MRKESCLGLIFYCRFLGGHENHGSRYFQGFSGTENPNEFQGQPPFAFINGALGFSAPRKLLVRVSPPNKGSMVGKGSVLSVSIGYCAAF